MTSLCLLQAIEYLQIFEVLTKELGRDPDGVSKIVILIMCFNKV